MLIKKLITWLLVVILLLIVNSNFSIDADKSVPALRNESESLPYALQGDDRVVNNLERLSSRLGSVLGVGNTLKGGNLVDSLIIFIRNNPSIDSLHLIRPFYYIGVYNSLSGKQIISLSYFQQALDLLKKYPDRNMEGRVLHFIGYANNRLGDHFKSDIYFARSLAVKKMEYGIKSRELILEYISLASANINIRDYGKAIEYSQSGLEIANNHPDSVPASDLAMLYQDIGIALLNNADYKQANRNLMKAYEIYNEYSLPKDDFYINLLDNLATSYFYLEQLEKCIEFYEKGIIYAMNDNSIVSLSLFSNYAVFLGEKELADKGVKILAAALRKAKKTSSVNFREYYLSLKNYAEYLREYNIDIQLAKRLFLECYDYSRSHLWDINLNNNISLGYSLTLLDNNEPEVALDSIQSLLFRGVDVVKSTDLYSNPDIKKIKPDKETWNILGAKYRILRKLFGKNKDIKTLESAANTSELLIAVLEKIRLNIGEEESRLLLGDKYRDSYMNAIECFNKCYKLTGDPAFLEKAFVYTEKSKAANLLASTREMKAIRYHIPDTLASAEKSLQQEISFYEAKVSEENNFEKRDNQKLRLWNDYLLVASQKRDSLKKVFENNYPEYYALKYNTQVIKTGEIPYLIGRDKNYISYVISDSLLYILVVNRKHTQLFVRNTDSSFFRTISQFRKLLSDPELSGNALNEFNLFQMCGYRLYSYLIEPVKEYLISDKLIISPDNSLAFFPFETLVTDDKIRNDLLYRKLPYLMKDYQISYTYSATLLSESKKTKSSLSNTTLIFAPSYHSVIYVDSLLIRRQPGKGILSDLPFAREEAVFVSHLTSGKLYQDDLATESAFKDEAGKFDIIHLAMHTVLNEKDPMNSGMIFSKVNDLTENRYLNTYEIYGISLNAKMVVLSSCYTGTGTLYAGEGVLSLARGFIFAGSRSVVMSLWEVDDRSGTDIVKLFYKNLKSGNTKSKSLRKARIKYMENSDKLRSHPYFWSTLVIYGDDSPLYYKMSFKILFILIPVLLICSAIIYFRKRRYS